MLYGRYVFLREEEELLKGVEAFPDIFSSLYDYLVIVNDFNALRYSNRIQNRFDALTRIVRSLNRIQQDKDVIHQSRLAGCDHNPRLKELERKHCLMHHIQQLKRGVHVYTRHFKINLPYNL